MRQAGHRQLRHIGNVGIIETAPTTQCQHGGDPLVRSPCENQSYANTFRKPVFMKRQTRLGSAFGQFYKINHP
jgi:hypothetical protein